MNFHHSMTISPLPAPFGQTPEVRHWCAPVLGKAVGDHSHRSVTEKNRCAVRNAVRNGTAGGSPCDKWWEKKLADGWKKVV